MPNLRDTSYLSGYHDNLFARPQSTSGAGGAKPLDLSLPKTSLSDPAPVNPTGIEAFKPAIDTGTYQKFNFNQEFKLPELAAPQQPLTKQEMIRNVREAATEVIGSGGVKAVEAAAGLAHIARGGKVGYTYHLDRGTLFESSSVKVEGSIKGELSLKFKASF